MRRILLIAALAAVAVAAIAASASAQRVTTITALSIPRSQHRSGHSQIQRGVLVDPTDRDDHLGRFHAKFTPQGRRGLRIRAVAVFGGHGSLKVKGTVGRGDNRISVIGGTRAFNGAAGKLKIHTLKHGRALLTFVFVQ